MKRFLFLVPIFLVVSGASYAQNFALHLKTTKADTVIALSGVSRLAFTSNLALHEDLYVNLASGTTDTIEIQKIAYATFVNEDIFSTMLLKMTDSSVRSYDLERVVSIVIPMMAGVRPIVALNGPSIESFPNPTTGDVAIRLTIAKSDRIHLSVYDDAGRFVAEITNAEYPPGVYELHWSGSSSEAHSTQSGAYFLRCDSKEGSQSVKIALVH